MNSKIYFNLILRWPFLRSKHIVSIKKETMDRHSMLWLWLASIKFIEMVCFEWLVVHYWGAYW